MRLARNTHGAICLGFAIFQRLCNQDSFTLEIYLKVAVSNNFDGDRLHNK